MNQTQTSPTFYGETFASRYDRVLDFSIRALGDIPRAQMAEFVRDVWSTSPHRVTDVLDLCCGTGLMLKALVDLGYTATGLDQSVAMLERARQRLGPDVPLVHARLPEIPLERSFHGVVSVGTAFTYLSPHDTLGKTFESVARVLDPGGKFVFDTLSSKAIDERIPRMFDASDVAIDLEDAVVVYKWQQTAPGEYSDLTWLQLTSVDGTPNGSFMRSSELHRMYVLNHEVIRKLATQAGFVDATAYDNYTWNPTSDKTAFETWVLIKA